MQELSVMMRSGVKPIIFLLNNEGYTIERYLHGMNRKYNDITNWCAAPPNMSSFAHPLRLQEMDFAARDARRHGGQDEPVVYRAQQGGALEIAR